MHCRLCGLTGHLANAANPTVVYTHYLILKLDLTALCTLVTIHTYHPQHRHLRIMLFKHVLALRCRVQVSEQEGVLHAEDPLCDRDPGVTRDGDFRSSSHRGVEGVRPQGVLLIWAWSTKIILWTNDLLLAP